jgi:hypothetical protein
MQYNETCSTLARCLDEIESLMAIVSERLRGSDIPIEGLFIERWPMEINNQPMYKIWDGIRHLEPVGINHAMPSMLTANDILEIVKHREILMRKF